MNINGKVVIVTGASSGIGLAAAKLLTEKGARVALVARSREKLEKLSNELPGSIVVIADMSNVSDIKKMIGTVLKEFKRIDILINNAGQGYDVPVEKIELDIFQKLMNLNLIGPLVAMQQVIPAMRKQGGGAIVNISSGTALMQLPNMAAYSSLKRALVGISLTANEELVNDHISVSVVYPYITDTDFEKNTIKSSQGTDFNQEGGPPFPMDAPEFVAEKILEAVQTGSPEVFVHDWMNPANRKD